MATVKALKVAGGALTEVGASDQIAGHVASSDVSNVVVLTKAAYDALSPPDANTLYFISDAVPAFYLLNQIKTAVNITLTAGNVWVRVDVSSAAVQVTLPATPSDGDLVQITDSAANAGTNNITIARNGKSIGGAAADFTINSNLVGPISFVYDAANSNWEFA